jgi:parallel beta-helix repeat protein
MPTIQSAINSAKAGDTVVVAPGTYYGPVIVTQNHITLESSGGPSATIIDGTGTNAPVITFPPSGGDGIASQSLRTILAGFTIKDGGLSHASAATAGILVQDNNVTVTNNVVTGNRCAGIWISGASAAILSNTISNTQDSGNGDCPTAGGSAIVLATANSAVLGSAPPTEIVGNTIANNYQGGQEGSGAAGISVLSGPALIQNNILHNDETARTGGAIYIAAADVSVIQNLIYDNVATCGGAAVSIARTYPSVALPGTIIFALNTLSSNGLSGLQCASGGASSANEIMLLDSGTSLFSTLFANNIVSGDSPGSLVACAAADTSDSHTVPVFDHNLFFNALGSLFDPSCTNPVGTFGNVSTAPQFADSGTGNFQSTTSAPQIDAGNTSVLALITRANDTIDIASDIAGQPRVSDSNATGASIIDIGANEAQGIASPEATTIDLKPEGTDETASLYSANVGDAITLSATYHYALANFDTCHVNIELDEDGKAIADLPISASTGILTFPQQILTAGLHWFVATYSASGSCSSGVSVPLLYVVSDQSAGYPTNTSLSVTSNPANSFAPITVTSTVSSGFGQPTGTVVFSANSQVLASAPIGANGVASATVSTLGAGSYSIVATYQASPMFEASSSTPVSETITEAQSVTSLIGSPATTTVGQSVTFTANVRAAQGSPLPTGTVVFSDGDAMLGSTTLNTNGVATLATAALSVGAHTITAAYSGNSNFSASSASATEEVTLVSTTTTLASSLNPAGQGKPVILAATVNFGGAAPSGNVSFEDGASSIGTATVNPAGAATLTISSLSVGTHNLYAVYAGGGIFASSTSSVLQETIVASGFNIALSPATLTLRVGQSGTTSVNVGSYGGYNGTVTLSTGALPQYVAVSFSPGSLALQTTTLSSTLRVSTAFDASSHQEQRPFRSNAKDIFLCSAALLLFSRRKRRRSMVLLFVLGLLLQVSVSGCGKDVEVPAKVVAPGTYLIPITATDVDGNVNSSYLTLVITS